MAALEYLYYRSWSRSTLLWLLTNVAGWLAITLLIGGENKDNDEIVSIVAVCAGLGSLILIPILNVQLAKPLEYPTRGGRFWRVMGTVTLVVVLTVGGLSLLTGGLGLLAVLFGGWAYLPAAWLATTLVYADWLFRADDAEWLTDDYLPTPGPDPLAEAPPEAG